jgi:ribosomal protein S1
MARGFESKSVQDQQSQDVELKSKPRREPQEIELDKKRESLDLSRRRVMNDLEATTSETRRSSLRAALAHLDAELAKLR